MSDDAHEFLATRHSLLARLKDWEDQTGWREFFDADGRLIYAVARKAGLSDAEAQDVVQETVLTVAKKIADFTARPDGSFKGWLLTIARRRIADQFETQQRNQSFLTPRGEEAGTANRYAWKIPRPGEGLGKTCASAAWRPGARFNFGFGFKSFVQPERADLSFAGR
jgi:RNA polymerase sigma-70 factor (ECF subfamily)